MPTPDEEARKLLDRYKKGDISVDEFLSGMEELRTGKPKAPSLPDKPVTEKELVAALKRTGIKGDAATTNARVMLRTLEKAGDDPNSLTDPERRLVEDAIKRLNTSDPSLVKKLFVTGYDIGGGIKVAPGWLAAAVPALAALAPGALAASGGAATLAGGAMTALRTALPALAKQAGMGAGVAGLTSVTEQTLTEGKFNPEATRNAMMAGAVANPVLGKFMNPLFAAIGSGGAGLLTDLLTKGSQPPAPGQESKTDTINRLVAAGDDTATQSQYAQWLITDPTAAQQLMTAWASTQDTSVGEDTLSPATPDTLTVSKPTSIVLKDDQGNPVLGPTGSPVMILWNEVTGSYDPLPVQTEETDEAGNRIRVSIDPLSGKETRTYLTRNPIRREVGGREVFFDPETGAVLSETDRPPVEQTIGGQRVLIDPDTGEVVHTFQTEEERRRKQIETAMPLLQQLAQIYSQPASRLRFLAQEGQQQGLTSLPDFSLLDILGSIFGEDTGEAGLEALQAIGLPADSGGFTVSPQLSEILGLPAGSPIPLGGLNINTLPSNQALMGLSTDEQSELDALINITTGGTTTLNDILRKKEQLRPPGGLGAGASLSATFRR